MRKTVGLIATIIYAASLAIIPAGRIAADTNQAGSPSATNGVVINEVKLGGSSDQTIPTEYVTLFNGSGSVVSLDNWKLEYAKSSNSVSCQSASWNVPASQITSLSGTLQPNQLSSPITRSLTDNSAGSLQLVDDNGAVQDLVGWGTGAPCSETTAAPVPENGSSIERYLDCAQSLPIDTGNNADDFTLNSTPNPSNLSGQYPASCQTDSGQPPDDSTGSTCEGVIINEFLPNPSGTDTGHEFIELYNPTKAAIALDRCSLQTSANSKTYDLSGITLRPGQYQAFYDGQTGLTLPNSAGGTVWLLSPTDELQSIDYPANLNDDVAWARFNDAWQATYAPTPNAANVSMPEAPCPASQYRDSETSRCRDIASSPTGSSSLQPCAPNQYRNPATNRCKLKVSASTLVPCAANQYRNPATNRCKSTTSSSGALKPCKPGQVRNPATNRCKSTAASNSLKPCKPGWTRNPATNRCRKGVIKGASIAGIQDVKSSAATGNTRWLLATGAVLAALGYAFYEWRQEITAKLVSAKSRLFATVPAGKK